MILIRKQSNSATAKTKPPVINIESVESRVSLLAETPLLSPKKRVVQVVKSATHKSSSLGAVIKKNQI